jgi:tRNA A-37 threonylcarbamoyl transferase component Bud32
MKETLGRYKIIKEIGRGAMGTVYQGYDPKIDRVVALKTIRKDRLAESRDVSDLVTRFQKEVRAAGKLVHPNIIVIYDTGEDEETAYVAMEYLEGDTLEGMIRKGIRFSLEKVIDIMDQICDGLEYTHRQGIVHRDLKPSNIMLVKGERVKITDFGISKAVGASTSPLTQAGVFLGTPSYMSPEQIAGNKIDGRADLFSLGIILYQLLTGKKPFVGNTISTLLYNIVNKDPNPPSQIDSSIPSPYDEVIAKALAKNPNKRYQTAKDFLEDLKRVYWAEGGVETPGIETTMTIGGEMREKFYPKRKRYGLLAGFVALLLLIVLGGVYWMHNRRAKPAKGEGVSEVRVGKRVAIPVEKEPARPILSPAEEREKAVVPEPSPTGEIRISSSPQGAKVFLNGKYSDHDTPTRLSGLSPGKYQLTLKKEGYEVWEGEVTVGTSESLDLSGVTLQEAFGKLNLHVSPWADVYYNGEKLGTTPLAHIQLQEGIHRLVLKNPLLNIEKGVTVRIVAHELTKRIVDLTEGIRGKLKIRVTPWAHVYVDGKPMGTTPLKPLELTVGEHIILVKNDKLGRQHSSRVIIKPNEVYAMEIDLLEKK